MPDTVSVPSDAVCEKRLVELAVVEKMLVVVELPKIYTLPCTANVADGLVVPTPKFPALVSRAPSVRVPDRRVAKARSPFPVCGTPAVPPINTEKILAVVVPVL